MKLKILILQPFLFISLSVLGQITIFTDLGISNKSGGLAYPYDRNTGMLPELPIILRNHNFEIGYQINSKNRPSIFMKRSTGILDNDIDYSLRKYIGLKWAFSKEIKGNSLIHLEITPFVGIGQEFIKWSNLEGGLFVGTRHVRGKDYFEMLQLGTDFSLCHQIKRLEFRVSISPAKDFILKGTRQFDEGYGSSQEKYTEFNYKGTFHVNFSVGLGIRLFRF